jgi:hypothetical protein
MLHGTTNIKKKTFLLRPTLLHAVSHNKKDSVRIELTLRRFPVTIVAMGKQYVLNIPSVGF